MVTAPPLPHLTLLEFFPYRIFLENFVLNACCFSFHTRVLLILSVFFSPRLSLVLRVSTLFLFVDFFFLGRIPGPVSDIANRARREGGEDRQRHDASARKSSPLQPRDPVSSPPPHPQFFFLSPSHLTKSPESLPPPPIPTSKSQQKQIQFTLSLSSVGRKRGGEGREFISLCSTLGPPSSSSSFLCVCGLLFPAL